VQAARLLEHRLCGPQLGRQRQQDRRLDGRAVGTDVVRRGNADGVEAGLAAHTARAGEVRAAGCLQPGPGDAGRQGDVDHVVRVDAVVVLAAQYRAVTTSFVPRITPSPTRNPIARSKSSPGVRIVTDSGSPSEPDLERLLDDQRVLSPHRRPVGDPHDGAS
jgi:hypothetical protein